LIGLAIGGPLFGFLAGRLGDSVRVMIIGTTIALISLVIAIYVTNIPLWLFGSLLLAFGLGTGVFMLSFPLGKEINPIGLAATVVALINTGDALFGSFTEPLIGRMLDVSWDGAVVDGIHVFSLHSYHVALVLLPVYLSISLLCLVGLKKLK
jgi:MFS family permease